MSAPFPPYKPVDEPFWDDDPFDVTVQTEGQTLVDSVDRNDSRRFQNDIDADQLGFPFMFPGLSWLAAFNRRSPVQSSSTSSRPLMGALCKSFLFPVPFCMATALSWLFGYLGHVTGNQPLGILTAILCYPLILLGLFIRLMFPIRYRPLLSLKQKIACIPLILITALLAGWIWVAVADHNGTGKNPFDLAWWCGLIMVVCISLAYL